MWHIGFCVKAGLKPIPVVMLKGEEAANGPNTGGCRDFTLLNDESIDIHRQSHSLTKYTFHMLHIYLRLLFIIVFTCRLDQPKLSFGH